MVLQRNANFDLISSRTPKVLLQHLSVRQRDLWQCMVGEFVTWSGTDIHLPMTCISLP